MSNKRPPEENHKVSGNIHNKVLELSFLAIRDSDLQCKRCYFNQGDNTFGFLSFSYLLMVTPFSKFLSSLLWPGIQFTNIFEITKVMASGIRTIFPCRQNKCSVRNSNQCLLKNPGVCNGRNVVNKAIKMGTTV